MNVPSPEETFSGFLGPAGYRGGHLNAAVACSARKHRIGTCNGEQAPSVRANGRTI